MKGDKRLSNPLKQIADFRDQKASPTVIPQAYAKLYSQQVRLRVGGSGLGSFTVTDFRAMADEATSLLHGALVEREASPSSNWRDGAKRAAELFEWLTPLQHTYASDLPFPIMAAAAYCLAGYSAMAQGVLRQIDLTPYSELLSIILRGDTRHLYEGITAYWSSLLNSEEYRRDYEEKLSQEVIRCLGIFCEYLRWGEEGRTAAALTKLDRLSHVFLHSQVPLSWLIAKAVAVAIQEHHRTSLRGAIVPLLQQATDTTPFERYARLAFLSGRTIAWPSQRIGIDRIATRDSFVLATPTGSGKTMVAELALISELFLKHKDDTHPLAMYIVPSRALAAEVEARLAQTLASVSANRVTVTGLYGGTDWGPTDAWITSDRPTVLICTFEKAEALLRHLGSSLLLRLRLLIVDEFHTAVLVPGEKLELWADNRALRLESLLARIRASAVGEANLACRVIGLSAVAAGAERALASWVADGSDASPARGIYRSTRQLLGRLLCQPNGHYRIEYDLLDRIRVFYGEGKSLERPFVPTPFPPCPPAPSMGTGPEVRQRPRALWAAMQLAAADGRWSTSVLIFVPQLIESFSADALRLLEGDWKSVTLPNFFTKPTDGQEAVQWEECLRTCEDYYSAESVEYRLLLRGIVVHHGRMPPLMARRLKGIVEAGIAKVVIATSTLSEGVNLPLEYVLIPSLYRGQKEVPRSEFENLIGRAGRPGVATEGKVLVLLDVTQPNERNNQYYRKLVSALSGQSSNSAAINSALDALIQRLWVLWQTISESDEAASFVAWLESVEADSPLGNDQISEAIDTLDSLVIAALEEARATGRLSAGTRAEIESVMLAVWSASFAAVTSINDSLHSRALQARGHGVWKCYPDGTERRQIYRTGLPPRSARCLLSLHDEAVAILQSAEGYQEWSPERRWSFLCEFLALVRRVPAYAFEEWVGRGKSAVAWREILRWWINPLGASRCPQPSQISSWYKFIFNAFSYRSAWAIGGFTSILFERLAPGPSIALSIQTWRNSGLPWIAFWIKELLCWGTHDPVEAYALAKNLAVTRSDAHMLASEYYKANELSSEIYDPTQIRDWFSQQSTSTNPPSVGSSIRRIPARLVQEPKDYREQVLRVFPVLRPDSVCWVDMAGYEVASSSAVSEQLNVSVDLEYLLDVNGRIVRVDTYL
jgi:hypothetical protein